jgi:hypothetical protein
MKKVLTGKGVKKKRVTVDKLTTVRGLVIPIDWDKEGKAVAVAISSQDERDYVVKLDEKGKELLKFIRHEIEVDCIFGKAIKNCKTIIVKSYKLKTGSDEWSHQSLSQL